MNFVKLYPGDYLRDTGTLTLAQHGAYMLMLLEFYATEKPLPMGRELHRLLRADGKPERDAIDFVAARFWVEKDGGLTNKRALSEIDRASHQRAINQEIGKRGGRPKRTESVSPEKTESVTEPEANRNPNQTPDTRHQKTTWTDGGDSTGVAPDNADPPAPRIRPEDPPPAPSLPGRACLAMRGANVHDVNPSHPDLLRLLAAGVTPEEIGATAAECSARGKGRMAYVLATVERRRTEAAAAPAIAAPAPIQATTVPSADADRTAAMLAERRAAQHMTPEERAAADRARREGIARLRGQAA